MVQTISLDRTSLTSIAGDVARELSRVRMAEASAYITTAVTYANGMAVVVSVQEMGDAFFVTDDGYGALTAEMMGGLATFNKVARPVGKRFGVEFDERSFFVIHANRDQLPAAVASVANVSAIAVERTVLAQESAKSHRSRVLFEERLQEAFTGRVHFNEKFRGALRPWRVDALVDVPSSLPVVFEYVAPGSGSVASAHLKLGDIKSLDTAPKAAVVLENYEATEPAFRAMLSLTSDLVIDAKAEISRYHRIAA